MIAFIRGELALVSESCIVVENNGVGFEILVPLSVLSNLPSVGNEVKIYTYTYVREDILQLYGFLTPDELKMFKLVITVNGIGPKGALGIFSVMDANALRFAILADDSKSISKAPGIGGKTASKLILELKDKCDVSDLMPGNNNEGSAAVGSGNIVMNDAIQALMALGYSSTEAANAVKRTGATMEMTVEEILKAALKNL